MTLHDLREVRSQIDRPGAFTILKFYIDESLARLDEELDALDSENINAQQRVIGQRQVLKHLISHFSHYVDNKIQETKDE